MARSLSSRGRSSSDPSEELVEAINKAGGQTPKQVGIKVDPLGQSAAFRIKYTGLGAAAFGNGGDHGGLEIGLGKNAGGIKRGHLGTQFIDAGSAGCHFGRNGDRAGNSQPKALLKILVRIVKDHKGAVSHRRQGLPKLGLQRIELFPLRLGVGRIGSGVFGIGLGQGSGNVLHHQLGILRIEPEVHIAFVVLVVVFTRWFGMLVRFVISMIMGFRLMLVGILMGMFMRFFPFMIMRLPFMLMCLEGPAFAHRQQRQAGRFSQFHQRCFRRERVERIGQKQFHAMPGPEHDVCRFQRAGIGGAQRICVGRRRAFDNQRGFTHAFHHRRDQRMHRLDRGHHIRCGHGSGGQQRRCEETGKDGQFHGQHFLVEQCRHCYVITLAAVLCYNVLISVKCPMCRHCLRFETAMIAHPPKETLITLAGAGVTVGRRSLVSGIDLTIRRGEIVTLIGPNGSGKSTTAKLVTGVLKPTSGTVTRRPGLRIGYVPQKLSIDWTLPLTVERLMTLTGRYAPHEIDAALGAVGAARLLKAPVQELSGGEFQRVLFARATIRKPDLLVLDEPVQGVDLSGEAALYALVRQIRDTTASGILMISHDLHVVMAETDTVLCLNGHVCCRGTPSAVKRSPEYLRLFGDRGAGSLAIYEHNHDHEHHEDGCVVGEDHSHGHHHHGAHSHVR